MGSDSSKRTARGDFGFTLVEVLVSISLFAVALTLLTGGFRYTSRAWESGERVTGETSDLVTVQRVFSSMLDRLFPVSLQPAGSKGYAFSGSSHHLRFVAQLPPYPAAGGLYTVEFSITSGNNFDRLELRLAPFAAETFDNDELKTDEQRLLLETSGRLSFSYYGNGVVQEWQANWPALEPPPQIVRLQFQETEESMPEIVVPIAVNMDLSCAFPELEGKCRL